MRAQHQPTTPAQGWVAGGTGRAPYHRLAPVNVLCTKSRMERKYVTQEPARHILRATSCAPHHAHRTVHATFCTPHLARHTVRAPILRAIPPTGCSTNTPKRQGSTGVAIHQNGEAVKMGWRGDQNLRVGFVGFAWGFGWCLVVLVLWFGGY